MALPAEKHRLPAGPLFAPAIEGARASAAPSTPAPSSAISAPPTFADRRTDLAAFEVVKLTISQRRREVLQAVADGGSGGLTSEQVGLQIGRPTSRVSPRLIELERAALVLRPGATRATSSGCQASIYVVTEGGRSILRRTSH